MLFDKATFLLSTLDAFPLLKDPKGVPLPEIALAGRSNVGKSSLINHFFGQKNLAKTSATPGKTQLLNFFVVKDKVLFVDLPGYGFAAAPGAAVEKWSRAIDLYLNQSASLRLILLLLDSRRDLTPEDRSLIDWAEQKQIPLLAILTKTDKLSSSELQKKRNETRKQLSSEPLPYSVMDKSCRYFLAKQIEAIL